MEPWLLEILGSHVTYVPVCPEVECGLPIPREPMMLVGERENPSLLTLNSGIDLSKQIWDWVEMKIAELASEELSGFVFKSKSPSCGLHNVELFTQLGGSCSKNGRGIFAAAFMKAFPHLPVVDEIQLSEQAAKENFLRVLGLDFPKSR